MPQRGTLTLLPGCRTQDLNREVVKTDCATARIPELDFEIPAFTQKGGGCAALGGAGWAGCAGAAGVGSSVTVLSLLLSSAVLTTIEGIIDRAVAGLEQDQPVRRVRCWAVGGSAGAAAASFMLCPLAP